MMTRQWSDERTKRQRGWLMGWAVMLFCFFGLRPAANGARIEIDTSTTQPSVTVDGVQYAPNTTVAATPPAADSKLQSGIPATPDGSISVQIARAGLATFFDGRACVPEAQRTRYAWSWDFGDGSPSRAGFNAGHVYETAGTYHVTLTLTDEGATRGQGDKVNEIAPPPAHPLTLSTVVTVPASTRRVVQVAAGMDLYKLSGSAGLEIVLAPGDYTASNIVTLYGCVIRGAGATLNLKAGQDGFLLKSGCRVDGLTFNWPALAHPKNTTYDGVGTCIVPDGRGIAVTNCTFLNVGYAVNGNRKPDGVLVQGCKAPLLDGLRAYLAWVEGGTWCIYDNTVANSTIEHCVRCERNSGPLAICDNTLNNLGEADSGVKLDNPKGSIVLHYTHDAYVFGNSVTTYGTFGGGIGAGPLMNEQLPGFPERTERTVIDGNTLHDAAIKIDPGAQDTVIRDNQFEIKPDSTWPYLASIVVTANDAARGRSVKGLVIRGNQISGKAVKPLSISRGTVADLSSDWSH